MSSIAKPEYRVSNIPVFAIYIIYISMLRLRSSMKIGRSLSWQHTYSYLEQHPNVKWVSYLSLPSHESHELAQKLLRPNVYRPFLWCVRWN